MCIYTHDVISLTTCRVHDYEERVKSLSIELVQVRSRLQAAEKKGNEPSPLLLKLQEELAQMKVMCTLCTTITVMSTAPPVIFNRTYMYVDTQVGFACTCIKMALFDNCNTL